MLTILAGGGSVTANPAFWVGVSFMGFVGLLIYYKVPALIGKALDDRADRIRQELDEARRLREEAQALLADYQRKREAAEEEAKAIVEQARREADSLSAETRRSLAESLERRTKLAEEKIARAEAQAIADVRSAAIDTAVDAAQRLLQSRMAGQSGADMIEQGIKGLKGKLN